MAYSKGYDKTLFPIGTHTVMHDKLQLVIQHPKGCPGAGAGLDKRKTFHTLSQALERLMMCGLTLTPEQLGILTEKGKVLAQVSR